MHKRIDSMLLGSSGITTWICSRCKALDLPQIFSTTFSAPRASEFLELWIDSYFEEDCLVCPLLDTVRPDDHEKSRLVRRQLTGEDLAAVSLYHPTPLDRNPFVLEWQKREPSPFYITELHPSALKSVQSWRSSARKVDFVRLRSWVQECCEKHKHSMSQKVPGMTLINVHTRKVVKTSPGRKYAALSYVWGSDAEAIVAPGRLPEKVPRTIEDSLYVTARLGIDYIWIDRYCIPQDQPKEKVAQIHKMHLIYQNAHVTLFATAGTGPNHGLPGISRSRRSPVHCEIDERFFAAFPRHPSYLIHESKWAKRAWTYQEAVLSTRGLFFTESGVLFRCGSVKSGAIEGPIWTVQHAALPDVKEGDNSDPRTHVDYISEIHGHIHTLKKREITDESDRVNASLGILGSLRDKGIIHGHIWGLPLPNLPEDRNSPDKCSSQRIETWEDGFLCELSWGSNTPAAYRIRGIPSWSWAGWRQDCNSHYSCCSDNVKLGMELGDNPLADGSLEKLSLQATRKVIPSYEFQDALGQEPRLSFAVAYLHLEVPVVWLGFDREGTILYADATGAHPAFVERPKIDFQWGPKSIEPFLNPANGRYSSKAWRGLLFSRQDGRGGILYIVEDLKDHAERFALCVFATDGLSFNPVIERDDGTFMSLFPGAKGPNVTVKTEMVRLG